MHARILKILDHQQSNVESFKAVINALHDKCLSSHLLKLGSYVCLLVDNPTDFKIKSQEKNIDLKLFW
jgi:hypothetical protein